MPTCDIRRIHSESVPEVEDETPIFVPVIYHRYCIVYCCYGPQHMIYQKKMLVLHRHLSSQLFELHNHLPYFVLQALSLHKYTQLLIIVYLLSFTEK